MFTKTAAGFAKIVLSFLLLIPIITFGLLWCKGLPSFAQDHRIEVLLWVFQVTWMPAVVSGLLTGLLLWAIKPKLPYFIRPFDVGRCFSLGAVSGALLEALSTWGYRWLSHRPFSSFWIAGAMIAGSITGAIVVVTLLRAESRSPLAR